MLDPRLDRLLIGRCSIAHVLLVSISLQGSFSLIVIAYHDNTQEGPAESKYSPTMQYLAHSHVHKHRSLAHPASLHLTLATRFDFIGQSRAEMRKNVALVEPEAGEKRVNE